MLTHVLLAVVVDGVVADTDSAWQGGVIVSRTSIDVTGVVEGEAPARLAVRHLGGAVDGIGQIAWDEPRFRAGDRLRLTLEERPDGDYRVVDAGSALRWVRTSSAAACPGFEVVLLEWPSDRVGWVIDAAGSPAVGLDATRAAVQASFDTWQAVECSPIAFAYEGAIEDVPIGFAIDAPNLNALKWIQSDWPFADAALAITLSTFQCSDGALFDADILFNDELFDFAVDGRAGAVDVANTATHEVGHLIGFDHDADRESTMFAGADLGETKKRDLTADDIDGLCQAYPEGEGGCGCRGAGRDGRADGGGWLVLLAILAWRGRSLRGWS